MIKYLSILFIVILLGTELYCFENRADTSVSITADGYVFNISSTDNGFFTGSLYVTKNGSEVFRMDSTFTDYIEHKFIDLDNNGSRELLLYLHEGASPYIFHVLYIFEPSKGPMPLFYINNGDVDTTDAKNPLITVDTRLSPSVLGLWYSWYLKYNNEKLTFYKPKKNELSRLRPDYEYVNQALKDLKENNQICDDFAYSVFFEYVFICSRLSGEESQAENYFKENYKCTDKVAALKRFKETASETYKWIQDENNYIYTEY